MTAAVNRAKLLNNENLKIAFDMLDTDGNGQITKDELRAVFHGAIQQSASIEDDDEQVWNSIMQ